MTKLVSIMQYGFVPGLWRKIQRTLASIFIFIFRLNSNSDWATEVCQKLEPVSRVNFDGHELIFMSGHGRLKWRAKSFFTEEPIMVDWLKGFQKRDVFLDVGANVGTYTIAAAKMGAHVLAIELDPTNAYCLNSNVCINKLYDKVNLIPLVASDSVSIQDVYYRDFSIGDALQSVGREQILPTRSPAPYKIPQLSMPIDKIISDFGLPQPNKIKIDVDGNEEIVLNGAWLTVEKADEIYLEDNGLDTDANILDRLFEMGFRIKKEERAFIGKNKSEMSRNILLYR